MGKQKSSGGMEKFWRYNCSTWLIPGCGLPHFSVSYRPQIHVGNSIKHCLEGCPKCLQAAATNQLLPWISPVAGAGNKGQTGQSALRGEREKFWGVFIFNHFIPKKTNHWIFYLESFKAFWNYWADPCSNTEENHPFLPWHFLFFMSCLLIFFSNDSLGRQIHQYFVVYVNLSWTPSLPDTQ